MVVKMSNEQNTDYGELLTFADFNELQEGDLIFYHVDKKPSYEIIKLHDDGRADVMEYYRNAPHKMYTWFNNADTWGSPDIWRRAPGFMKYDPNQQEDLESDI